MAFNFARFNKERLFNIDTTSFEYTNLEQLYNEAGPDAIHKVTALYIGTKSIYDEEAPVLATDSEYVNLPVHQLAEVKEMLADRRAIAAINNGECGFKIEEYYQARFKKNCYVARWCNYEDTAIEQAIEDIPFA